MFGGSWKRPHRDTISAEFFDNSYSLKHEEVIEALSNVPELSLSSSALTATNSPTLFNLMEGAPLPFVLYTFRLNGRKESTANLDR